MTTYCNGFVDKSTKIKMKEIQNWVLLNAESRKTFLATFTSSNYDMRINLALLSTAFIVFIYVGSLNLPKASCKGVVSLTQIMNLVSNILEKLFLYK